MKSHSLEIKKISIVIASALMMAACGGGGGSDSGTSPNQSAPSQPATNPPPEPVYSIEGAGVKGPLKYADVSLYKFAPGNTNGLGLLVASATTNENALISDMQLVGEPDDWYVIQFTANDGTIDMTTGSSPVFSVLRNLVSAEQIKEKDFLFATPLSTLTLKVILSDLTGEGITEDTISASSALVRSAFVRQVSSQFNTRLTVPIVYGDTNEDSLEKLWEARLSNEIFAAQLFQFRRQLSGDTVVLDQLMNALASDLKDGSVDGVSKNELPYSSDELAFFSQSVNKLNFAGANNKKISLLLDELKTEITEMGIADIEIPADASLSNISDQTRILLNSDIDDDGVLNSLDSDLDGDNIENQMDLFPTLASEWRDNDLDFVGDNADTDDDNDGVLDIEDAFPYDNSESIDSDNDGIGNNADIDDDNDNVEDLNDSFPLDSTEFQDNDKDGIGDNADQDDDNDGVADINDVFPLDSTESVDNDEDGVGNNADQDDDNDGVDDVNDVFPLDNTESVDTDDDGIGNNADTDDDNDNVEDVNDSFPLDDSEYLDNDEDGIGNNADPDDDNDGVDDVSDAFPLNSAESIDTDEDGIGNNADTDDDNDGVFDINDMFPFDSTETFDLDNDGIGDNFDNDDDNDTIIDALDNIEVARVKDDYLAEAQIEWLVRGKTTQGGKASSSMGYHVQYYTYDETDPNNRIQRYTEENFFNGLYNPIKEAWEVTFPAPSYEGNFRTDVSFYCSRANNICNGERITQLYRQSVYYSVTCTENDTCKFFMQPDPGVNITSNESGSLSATSFIQDNTGKLRVSYRVFGDDVTLAINNSNDHGATWFKSTDRLNQYSSSRTVLYNAPDGALYLLTSCGSSSLCVLEEVSFGQWDRKASIPIPTTKTCFDSGICVTHSPSEDDIIQLDSGEFMVSFSRNTDGNNVNVYTITSFDLENWTAPVQVANDEDFDFGSKVIQLSNGSLLMAYISYGKSGIEIVRSDAGEDWEHVQTIEKDGYASSVISFTKSNEDIRLFYVRYGKLYYEILQDNGQFESPIYVTDIEGFEPHVIRLDDGSYGMVYSLDHNETRDIFFENLGNLN
ncbi:sialidase family protein [Agaribacter marinus]|uniref:Uncharacterized protein n=1 Tax=Agaribacter marinus TaxID=1431249 RepID=A0AA37T5K2_9ALTE|nr:sialidase family protein [Agaribacter marinus]GLR72593.1 hypothetical protein GCM10007852_35010 [Agaribacter marinus]